MDASSSTPEAGFLTVGEVCQEFGLTLRALRFYETGPSLLSGSAPVWKPAPSAANSCTRIEFGRQKLEPTPIK